MKDANGRALADLLSKSEGGTIEVDGRSLRATHSVTVSEGASLRLVFLRSASAPVQGLGLHGVNCSLKIGGVTNKDLALWCDTAPRNVTCDVVNVKAGARVEITNQWRDDKYGTTMYKLNNAAMEVLEQADNSLLLRCSDGWGDADFNDLVVQVFVA